MGVLFITRRFSQPGLYLSCVYMDEESFQLYVHQLLQAADKQEFIGCFRIRFGVAEKQWSYDLYQPSYSCYSAAVSFRSRFEKECEPLIEQAFQKMHNSSND